jgi:hypothetical protein
MNNLGTSPAAIKADQNSVTYVQGTWNVATLTGPSKGIYYSSTWVGIDGWANGTVEQIGTESDWVNGVQQNYVWYEMYGPANTVYWSISVNNFPIKAGDSITAWVQFDGSTTNGGSTVSTFTLHIQDNNSGQIFQIDQSRSNIQRTSAEWVVEAPSSGGVLPLANFSPAPITFTNASAIIGGISGPINGSHWQNASIYMFTNKGVELDAPSALSANGSSFSVKYVGPTVTNGPNGGAPSKGTAEGVTPATVMISSVTSTSTTTSAILVSFPFPSLPGMPASLNQSASLPQEVVSTPTSTDTVPGTTTADHAFQLGSGGDSSTIGQGQNAPTTPPSDQNEAPSGTQVEQIEGSSAYIGQSAAQASEASLPALVSDEQAATIDWNVQDIFPVRDEAAAEQELPLHTIKPMSFAALLVVIPGLLSFETTEDERRNRVNDGSKAGVI